jgi:tetratricopeptide (TPR) repeat protein
MRSFASIATGVAIALLTFATAAAQPDDKKPDPDQPPQDPIGEIQSDPGEKPWAKGVAEDEKLKAQELFNEGNSAMSDGLFPQAADKYREALKHWDHPGIHYNLALALVNLDQPVEMYGALEKSLVYGAEPLGGDERFARAKDFLKLVESNLVRVEYTVSEPGSVLILDGKEVLQGPGTFKAMIREGEHAIAARAEGYSPTQLNLKLLGGETSRMELQLFTDAELTREKRMMPAWVPYTVLGAGVVLGGLAVWQHTGAKSGFEDYDAAIERCSTMPGNTTGGCAPDPTTFDIKSSAESKQTLAIAMYTVGGVALASGVVLVILNRPKSYRIDPLSKQEGLSDVSVTPVFGPDGAGAALSGRF